MDRTLCVDVEQRLWDTFAADREHLYDQYQDISYSSATGLSPEELEQEVARWLDEHADQPHVQQKAHVFQQILTRAQIHVDPLDWFPDKFNHGTILQQLRQRWHRAAMAGATEEHARWFQTMAELGIGLGCLDTGHISPGWERMFSAGLSGLIDEARHYQATCAPADQDRRAFYAAVETVCTAAIALAQRFADLAESLMPRYPAYRQRLQMMAETCRRVPAHAPRTFYEALYFSWLMHELVEYEGEAVRSLGRFDVLFYPYYHADLEAGRLTRAQAKEMLQYYWMKSVARTRGSENGAHFVLGGQTPDGTDASNELTELILEAREALNAPDPKVSVRFFAGSPPWLYQRVLEMVRRGHNAFVLINDGAVVPALQKRGKALEDARSYLPIGCYEPAVDGKEAACTTNLVVNLAKGVELALYNGTDPISAQQIGPFTGSAEEFDTFASFEQAAMAQLDYILDRSAAAIAAHERAWSKINPSPLIASSLDDCLARGRDVGDGGCHYNAVGCVGAGLANAADSLLAIKRAVFDDRRYTLLEVAEALRRDFQGCEAMRQYLLRRVPKWGNDDAEADSMAQQLAEHYCTKVHTFTNERGGPYQAALYSFTFQWALGRGTGALPDGRQAHTPLAPGVGAMAGRDTAGLTALLASVSKLDFSETPNGSVLDLRLHPSSVAGAAGLEALVILVKTFFQQGGLAVQFNILDAETLKAAQHNPEAYASLQVRVAGYSAYFVQLSKEMQDHLIAQNTHCLQ
jgi:pyruvate formate-lyase/glycerol dehydratase family glycyl radical enzyme